MYPTHISENKTYNEVAKKFISRRGAKNFYTLYLYEKCRVSPKNW